MNEDERGVLEYRAGKLSEDLARKAGSAMRLDTLTDGQLRMLVSQLAVCLSIMKEPTP